MAEVVKSTRTRIIPVVAGLQVRVLPAELQRRPTALYKTWQAGRRARFFSEVGMSDPRWSPAWKRMRVQCFERDKAKHAVCVHCGQPIDYEAKPSTTDDSYEPDHRVPIETHPEYALLPENVQPSHKKCNRARGSRAGINNLGKRTRNWGKGS